MELGDKINLLRLQAGLTQEELADNMNVSRQAVSKWENDSAVPELDKLIKLSKIFGVTLELN